MCELYDPARFILFGAASITSRRRPPSDDSCYWRSCLWNSNSFNAVLVYLATICGPRQSSGYARPVRIAAYFPMRSVYFPNNGDKSYRLTNGETNRSKPNHLLYRGNYCFPARWRDCSANAKFPNPLILKWIRCRGFRFLPPPSPVTSLYVFRPPLQFDGGSADGAFTLLQNGTRVLGRWRDCRCHRDHLEVIQAKIGLCGREQNTQQR